MALLKMSPEQEKALHDWIHKEYGRKAGLLTHEYSVEFDDEMKNEVEIHCGKRILILCKYPPYHSEFRATIRRIFNRLDLREFIRSQALVRLTPEDIKWRELKINTLLPQEQKKPKVSVNSYTVKYVTEIEVTDKRTKQRVTVKAESNAFDALDKALQILYGNKLK